MALHVILNSPVDKSMHGLWFTHDSGVIISISAGLLCC